VPSVIVTAGRVDVLLLQGADNTACTLVFILQQQDSSREMRTSRSLAACDHDVRHAGQALEPRPQRHGPPAAADPPAACHRRSPAQPTITGRALGSYCKDRHVLSISVARWRCRSATDLLDVKERKVQRCVPCELGDHHGGVRPRDRRPPRSRRAACTAGAPASRRCAARPPCGREPRGADRRRHPRCAHVGKQAGRQTLQAAIHPRMSTATKIIVTLTGALTAKRARDKFGGRSWEDWRGKYPLSLACSVESTRDGSRA
jgi:hypothetical protein